ncbi:hypothetical protein FB45DRAFT_1013091 [Roridomyces roridus]|uniref:Uncharacterized protein n=1 Tax=Roridomyces roridus TaxID=1738132 RepID=A0AAD7AYR6_9AGAR|nr:hypothetical protein FB45DRAFT_1013091 [Roridomyces roridus]
MPYTKLTRVGLTRGERDDFHIKSRCLLAPHQKVLPSLGQGLGMVHGVEKKAGSVQIRGKLRELDGQSTPVGTRAITRSHPGEDTEQARAQCIPPFASAAGSSRAREKGSGSRKSETASQAARRAQASTTTTSRSE